MKSTLPVVIVFAVILCLVGATPDDCPCSDKQNCETPKTDFGMLREVYVFSNGTTDVTPWKWDTITTLVVPSSFDINNKKQAETMCVAHSKGRKFAITVNMTLSGKLNETSSEATAWVNTVVSKFKAWHAEIVMVDLLPYFLDDMGSSQEDHLALVKILNNVKKGLNTSYFHQLNCIVPWKPPCAEGEASCDFSWLSTSVCDFYIINPDSFTDLDDVKCRARATIPFSKLLYGVSEYNSHHVTSNRILIGVPWHGYDYTCGMLTNGVCTLQSVAPENSTQTKCSFNQRLPLSNGQIFAQYKNYYMKHEHSDLYNAPYFTYIVDSVQHQIWFEDHYSLNSKYRLVSELGLKGIGVMYGDDLSTDFEPASFQNDAVMWSWVAHEFILSTSQNPPPVNMHYADTVAGVAVGCLVLGTLLGVIFTCIGLRKRVKKPKQPFLRDADTGIDDYNDDEPNL